MREGIELFDFIIVGAGSAGATLAYRLSEDGRNRVLVLEAGGSDRSLFIQMPAALSIPLHSKKFAWQYMSEPEPHLDGRRMHCPRGKVIGGSSSINGMVYVRGNRRDFDGWDTNGARGWAYRDVLPYFQRAESAQEGATAYRGSSGPLATQYGALKNPLYKAFIEAAKQAGHTENTDINGWDQEGFGRLDMTVKNGLRWSSANAYLKPAMKRHNVDVRTHCLATRILFDGKRAVGIAYQQGDQSYVVHAAREVILAGGAINSPQLLMLSGIGPAGQLREHGIDAIADRPGVGENLQDHLEFYHQMSCTQPITLYTWTGLLGRAIIGAQWLLTRTGLGATNHFESCGFIRSGSDVAYPDIQYHFLPIAVAYDGKGLANEHGFQAHVGTLRSKSRGHLRLTSANPRDYPRILFNYMSHPDDWTEMRAALRKTREIFAQDAFSLYRGREIMPGPDVQDNDQMDAFLRQHLETAYHPCGTAKMGTPDDGMAVVDPQTRVIGVEGLRVVDASIMPLITSGNLNAPVIMMGEKAADHILGKPMLALEEISRSPAQEQHA